MTIYNFKAGTIIVLFFLTLFDLKNLNVLDFEIGTYIFLYLRVILFK